jgi:hypothetical protein
VKKIDKRQAKRYILKSPYKPNLSDKESNRVFQEELKK